MARDALKIAVLLALMVVAAPPLARPGESGDAFDAMIVHRPAEPFPAPDVAFAGLNGRPMRLGDLRGKVVLLGFFATT